MNYKKHYFKLIEKAQQRQKPQQYTEDHHIIPRCIGGSDDESNLVYLTPREHILAHWLLFKFIQHHRLAIALHAVCMDSKSRNIKLTKRLRKYIKQYRVESMEIYKFERNQQYYERRKWGIYVRNDPIDFFNNNFQI